MSSPPEPRPAADGDAAPAVPVPPAPPATQVVLVRHAVTGETGPVLSGRRPGIDLSEKGRAQAEAVGARLSGVPVAAVYASPLERCVQTAEAIAAPHGLSVEVLPGLAEADYGDWSGQKIDDLRKTDLWKLVQVSPSAVRFPGGESMREMQARMIEAVEAVAAAHPGQVVVVCSHADPVKAVVAHFTGVHLDLFQRLFVSPASVTVLRIGPSGAALVKLNDTGSLDDLKPSEQKPEDAGATTDPGGAAAPVEVPADA